MERNFRTLFRKFCLESTVQGLKYFYLYPDLVSRCFWLANMIAVLYLACLLTWYLYSRFAEMPTRVTIENQYEPLLDLPYPAITLCSPNQITASFMTHFNRTLVDGNITINLEKVLPKLMGFYELVRDVDPDDMARLQSLVELNRYTATEIMAALPQSCDDFLKKCYFDGREEPCSKLFRPLLTSHGLCCAFNSIYHYHDKSLSIPVPAPRVDAGLGGNSAKENLSHRNMRNHRLVLRNVTHQTNGFRRGLIVVTDFNPDDAIDGTILDAGAAKVMFTDYTEFPTDDESSFIESNVETYHSIYATYTYCSDDVRALPAWSRNCYMEDERDLPYFRRYHNSDCDLTCFALAVRQYCRCSLFYLPRIMIGEHCNLTNMLCVIDVKARMSEWLTSEQCDCPRDCESRRYKVDMLIGNLDALPHMMHNPFKGIKFNFSSTIMSFFFANSVYVKQKQETVMSLITLASNLGGVFGLCLGCSGISVLEILFYIYIGIKSHIKSKLRLKRTWPKKPQRGDEKW